RLGDELLHDLELRCGRRLGLDTPTLRKNGQLLDGPALVLLAVAFGRNRLHQMTDAPGHDDTRAAVAAVAALAGAQHRGMSLPWEGFSHRNTRMKPPGCA